MCTSVCVCARAGTCVFLRTCASTCGSPPAPLPTHTHTPVPPPPAPAPPPPNPYPALEEQVPAAVLAEAQAFRVARAKAAASS